MKLIKPIHKDEYSVRFPYQFLKMSIGKSQQLVVADLKDSKPTKTYTNLLLK